MKTGMNYMVKEWFANKVAQEVKRNINMCEVFAVLKETEKAAYVMLNLGTNFRKCTWIPKSALVERAAGWSGEEEKSEYYHETLMIADYDEAVAALKAHWDLYR